MPNEPPTPKTHFAILPAKPKGTLADYDAGNLPPASPGKEPTVATGKRGSRPPRRRPNPARQISDEAKAIAAEERKADTIHNDQHELKGQLTPYQRVLDDLLFKRSQIDLAIKALQELYE